MKKLFLAFVISIITFSSTALAVPPPDFIVNVGTQVAQIFGIITVFLSAICGALWQYSKIHFQKFKYKKIVILGLILFVMVLSIILTWGYQYFQP